VGEYLQARNDTTLFDELKEHAEAEHPGRYADPDLHVLIDTAAYDAAEEGAWSTRPNAAASMNPT
jgi:hypothetical protein